MSNEANALDALYREVILDHHRSPRNYGKLSTANAQAEGYNPLCGDRIEIFVDAKEGKILSHCNFRGEGCSICMASASMMTEELTGKTVQETEEFIEGFRQLMRSEKCPLSIEGDLESIIGVRNFPVRIKCALLPWTTLSTALENLKNGEKNE